MNNRLKFLLPILLFLITSFHYKESKKVNIIFIGDSITEGGALANPATDATPLLVQKYSQKNKRFSSVSIANMGFSGHTTVDFLPATHTDFLKVLAAANKFAFDKEATLVFSIMLGTNDSAIFGPNGAPVSPAGYKANLKIIIDSLLLQFPEAKFILQYPLWYSPNTYNNSSYLQEGLQRVEAYRIKLDELIKNYQTANQQVFAGDKTSFNFFRKNHQKLYKPEQGKQGIFYLHPNTAGSEELSKRWAKSILKIIK